MTSTLLKFLRILHLARQYIGRVSSRLALLIVLLGRRLSKWRACWPGKPGSSKPAESSIPSNSRGASLFSVSGGLAASKEYVVAASTVPASASQGSLHGRAEGQPLAATAPRTPRQIPPATPSADQSRAASRCSSNVSSASTQSCGASDRLSIITNSRESLVGQPSRLARSPHHQFGLGPDASRSGGRSSRSPSPSPIHLPSTAQQPHQPDIVSTISVPTHVHADGRISSTVGRQSPVGLASSSSNTPEPQSRPLFPRKQRATSIDLDIQEASDSEEDPSIVFPTNLEPLTEEPMAIDSPTHPFNSSVDHLETASSVVSEYVVPEGRFLQLFHSEQVLRCEKHSTMSLQVYYTIIFIQSLHVLTDPGPVRKDLPILCWSP
jgi:hypothetical protein